MNIIVQYGCGPGKIQQLLGCPQGKAKGVYDAFHDLYSGLGAFAEQNIRHAKLNGYVECAFGLRLRTPTLAGTINQQRTSPKASAEGRSASNAVTQSWGMLMNRALNEFEARVMASPYRDDILNANTIHDSGYGLCKATPEVIKFVNDNLIDCMEWQEGKVASEEVKMLAEVDFGKSWDKQPTMKNKQTIEQVIGFMEEHELC